MRLNRSNSHFLILIGDIAIIPLSFVLGHYLRFGNTSELGAKVPFISLIWITLGYLLVFYFFNLYEMKRDQLSLRSVLGWITGVLTGAVFVSFLNYGLFLEPIGRGIFIFANISIFLFAFLWRLLFHKLVKYIFKPKRIVIIGTGDGAQKMAGAIRSHSADYKLVGFLEDETREGSSSSENLEKPILGSMSDLLDIAIKERIELLVPALCSRDYSRLGKDLMSARMKGVDVKDMPELFQSLERRIPIDFISELWLLNARGFDWSEKSMMIKIKRLMDVLFSCLFLLLSLPLWPIVSLLIKLTSRGPVFYSQKRVGRNEEVFSLFKFRSMVDKAEGNGAVWARENDTRITPVGNVLRKLHLDEFPQLINVLKGEMSLVGARPERPVFVESLNKAIPFYSLRHFQKPGLTGWAQVNYPYASSLEDSKAKLEYDLYYVYHMTLLLDLRIILKTVRNVFRKVRA